MNSQNEEQIKKIQSLIKQGQLFTFKNFSEQKPDKLQHGGEDSKKWSTWKQRSSNIVYGLMKYSSLAYINMEFAMRETTQGKDVSAFDRAKEMFLKSLELTLKALYKDAYNERQLPEPKVVSPSYSDKRIFVVYGHDPNLKLDVENFLHRHHLDPVVLHRERDDGQTIIEKIEKHSDVGYAFILLTPDDIAYPADEQTMPDEKRTEEKRARQNVIFEWGYFVGKLGRDRVCCLLKGDVTIPSDLQGFVYKKVDESLDSQALSIIQELIGTGYNIEIK